MVGFLNFQIVAMHMCIIVLNLQTERVIVLTDHVLESGARISHIWLEFADSRKGSLTTINCAIDPTLNSQQVVTVSQCNYHVSK